MGRYDDIIDRDYKGSTSRQRMSLENRAAQFAPFAALAGHDEAINETARLTIEKKELCEDEQRLLSERFALVLARLADHPIVTFVVYRADRRKSGGEYVTISGAVKKYEEFECLITLADGQTIPLADVVSISGEIFNY